MVGTFSYNSPYYPILGLDNWDVSKVTNMDQLSFGSVIDGVVNWDVSSVTSMNFIFGASSGNVSIPPTGITNWNVSNVTGFTSAFRETIFDPITSYTGISNWNVSSTTNKDYRFFGAGMNNFPQLEFVLTSWCVSNIPVEPTDFYSPDYGRFGIPIILTPPIWGSCNTTPTPTPTVTPTNTPTQTNTPSPTQTIGFTPSNTATNTSTPTNTPTQTNTASQTETIGFTPSNTPTQTNTPSVTRTVGISPTPTNTPSNTATNTPSVTRTVGISPTPTNTPSNTATNTPSVTGTVGISPTPTNTPSNTATNTPSVTPSQSGFVSYAYTNLGTGGSDPEACSEGGNTFYGIRASFSGLQIGDILYIDTNLNTPATGFGFVSNGVISYQIDGGTGEITSISSLC
jgi:hypothetical protein